MSLYSDTVKIVHCGGEEELAFIDQLECVVKSGSLPKLRLDYTRYYDNRSIDGTIIHDIQKCKKEKIPLIVLISTTFLDLVWKTVNKKTIVTAITTYPSRKCLHVWLNVNQREVLQRSKALILSTDYFRTVKSQELKNLETALKTMIGWLQSAGKVEVNALNNYAVDDEIEDMYRRYRASIVTTEDMRENDSYHQLPRTFLFEDIDNLPNKKFRTMACTLSDITEADYKTIATSLSKGPGANWKQLAQAFRFDNGAINALMESSTSESARSKGFLDLLKGSMGQVEVEDLIKKCRQIFRNDVATYIRDNVTC